MSKQMEAYRHTGTEPVTVFHRTVYPGETVDLWPGQAVQLETQYPGVFVPAGQSAQAEANVETQVKAPAETEAETEPATEAKAKIEDKPKPAEETKAQAESKPASTRRTSTRRTSTRSKQVDEAEPETKESEDDA